MPAPVFLPGPSRDTVRTPAGQTRQVPAGWDLVPPGDAALTRRVKVAGDHWLVQEQVGRRVFSRGVWAPRATIQRVQQELAAERSTESYGKRRAADAKRRAAQQAEYVEDFASAVVAFLAFHERHAGVARQLAQVVAAHATPVGSGTVARTKRIPIERRAEAAVIAWMRHQTTGYDAMKIARVKGQRCEVRRMLAQRSKELLGAYRRGDPIAATCPLARALTLPQARPSPPMLPRRVLLIAAVGCALSAPSSIPAAEPAARELFSEAVRLFFDAEPVESARVFDRLVAVVPAAEPELWQRGLALYYAERFDDGRKQFESHRTVNPNDVENPAWHFLCVARLEGLQAARGKLLPVGADPRVPMREILDLYAGRCEPAAVLAAAEQGEPAEQRNQSCYAHLYLGLFFEVAGDAQQARAHITRAAGPFRMDHFMGQVAVVHARLRNWPVEVMAPSPP